MNYIVDHSVAFMWVVPEPLSPNADRLRDDFRNAIHNLHVPDLFTTEVANSLVVAERRGRILVGQSTVLFADVATTMPFIHASYPDVLTRAHAIAASSVASVYDALYVALAEKEKCELVTADDRLVRNLQSRFPFIVALKSLP
jgi:predicted nucleic acid-binding protein